MFKKIDYHSLASLYVNIKLSRFKTFIASLLVGLLAAVVTFLTISLTEIDLYSQLGKFLFSAGGVLVCFTLMFVGQFQLRYYDFEPLVGLGIAVAWQLFFFLVYQLNFFAELWINFICGIMVFIISFVLLLFANTGIMMVRGEVEWGD